MADLTSSLLPPAAVLDAFGVKGARVPLVGGQGRSVRVGASVFKPVDRPETAEEAEEAEEEAEWAAAVFEQLAPRTGFRVPRPLRTADGRYAVDGWCGAEFLRGEAGPGEHWTPLLCAGRAFHAALRGLPRPGFLDRRTHPWAVADRVAWGERAAAVHAELAGPLAALLERRKPVERAAQLIHGDLTGNVLFTEGEAPAVIDFSPYWRPPVFAEAVVVADGLLWFDPPPDLLASGGGDPDWQQMLIRALIFRLVAQSELAGPTGPVREAEAQRYARATEAVLTGPVAR